MTLYLIAILLFLMGGAVILLIGAFILSILEDKAPYGLFRLHAKQVQKGWYTVARKEDSFVLNVLGIKMRVRELQYTKKIEFFFQSGDGDYFKIYYEPKTQSLKEFSGSHSFAKAVNEQALLPILTTYIPYVLANEFGKKTHQVLAAEKVASLGKLFVDKSTEESNQNLHCLTATNASAKTLQIIQQINEVITDLNQKKQALDMQERHVLENLVTKRLPNLLQYSHVHEKEVENALEEALHKLQEWQQTWGDVSQTSFEKELLLLKKITQS